MSGSTMSAQSLWGWLLVSTNFPLSAGSSCTPCRKGLPSARGDRCWTFVRGSLSPPNEEANWTCRSHSASLSVGLDARKGDGSAPDAEEITSLIRAMPASAAEFSRGPLRLEDFRLNLGLRCATCRSQVGWKTRSS